jgi:hypothetical protein
MNTTESRSIQNILKKKIKTPLIWIVIVITIGLTSLFYVSQEQQAVVYNRYVENLSEYKFLETRLMRSLEKTRVGSIEDSTKTATQIMSLREIAISISSSIENFRLQGEWMPPSSDVILFEREIFGKTGAMRQYLARRNNWSREVKIINDTLYKIPEIETGILLSCLDSARLGYTPSLPETLRISPEIIANIKDLLAENDDLFILWNRFDNDNALILSENLLQAFKIKSINDEIFKSRVPQVFYFLSIILLLSTLFFVFRSKT